MKRYTLDESGNITQLFINLYPSKMGLIPRLPLDQAAKFNGIVIPQITRIPDYMTAVHVHAYTNQTMLILARRTVSQDCELFSVLLPDCDEYAIMDHTPTLIATVRLTGLDGVTSRDELLMASCADGIRYFRLRDNAYQNLGTAPELPTLQFGLQKAATLVMTDKYEVPASMAPQPDSQAPAMSTVHPSTQDEALAASNASRAIMKDFQNAMDAQAAARGLFHEPFHLRYGLKMTDGTYAALSSPILMLGYALPPCIEVAGSLPSDDRKKCTLTLSSTACPLFQLRYRMLDALPAPWLPLIASIDVFVSEPIATYQRDNIINAGCARYIGIASQRNHTDNGPSTEADILAGCWSEYNDNYTDHTLQDLALGSAWAWRVMPNPAMIEQMKTPRNFRLAASIPVSQLSATFAPVPIDTAKHAAWPDMASLGIDEPSPIVAIPAMLENHLGNILGAQGTLSLQAPQPLLSACEADSSASDPTYPYDIEVQGTLLGADITSAPHGPRQAPDLTAHFPRYLYYPHPQAHAMSITQNGHRWTMPLTPTADAHGAYWLGDLVPHASPPVEQPPTTATPPTTTLDDTTHAYAMGGSGLPRLTNAFATGGGHITALIQPSKSEGGQASPLYACTSQGIWSITENKGQYAARSLIDRSPCLHRRHICPTPAGLAYVAAGKIRILSGTKAHTIEPPNIPRLRIPGIEMPPPLTAILDQSQLLYAPRTNALLAGNWSYAMDTKTWHWHTPPDPETGLAKFLFMTQPHDTPKGLSGIGLTMHPNPYDALPVDPDAELLWQPSHPWRPHIDMYLLESYDAVRWHVASCSSCPYLPIDFTIDAPHITILAQVTLARDPAHPDSANFTIHDIHIHTRT